MANYQTHVSVGAAAGLLTVGISSLWLSGLGWDVLLLGVFLGFLGGMIPDIDHDKGFAVSEIGALLSTMMPVVSLAVWAHGRGDWVTWSLTVVIPCHYLLHWQLPRLSGWGKSHHTSFKRSLQTIVVAAICGIPTLFLFPKLPFGYFQTWAIMIGIATAVQLGIPVVKWVTVHRGVLHSVPFSLIFSGIVYLFLQPFAPQERVLLTLAAWMGTLSHLILDEIYAVNFDGKKIRLKQSFGTAFKFWDRRFPKASSFSYAVVFLLAGIAFFTTK